MDFKKIPLVFVIYTVLLSVFLTLSAKAVEQGDIKIYIDGEEKNFAAPPYINNGSIFLPMRGVFESLGAEVSWDNGNITATTPNTTISLKVGSNLASINGKSIKIDKAPFVYKGTTMVPVRFVSEALGKDVKWDQCASTVYIGGKPYISSETKQLKINGKTFKLNIVRVDLNNEKVGMKVVLAKDRIGLTEPLKDMARRHNALAAINGTFFNAYEEIKEPVGNIIADHKIAHFSDFGTTFGFTDDNQTKFDTVKMRLDGITNKDGQEIKWVPYTANHTPAAGSNTIALYTSHRGDEIRFNDGISVVIENGIISQHVNGNVAIPKNGFVVNLSGKEVKYLDRFPIGAKAYYSQRFEPKSGDEHFWQKAAGALGAGPKLITDGKVTVDPKGEGFSSEKILTYSMARSAVGVTADNTLLLVTVNRATIYELASIMKTLGAYNAMNLDGGASSGLYYNGRYLTTPGRELSNSLIIYKK